MLRFAVRTKTTFTENVAEPALPCRSTAAHVTFVVPSGKRVPDLGPHAVATRPSTMSTADTVQLTTARVPLVLTVFFAGALTLGGVRSTTVIRNVDVVVCPSAVALHETVVVATAKVEPEDGTQLTGIARLALSKAPAA
jgi:hypothetical protein